jgi:hypothetical protein
MHLRADWLGILKGFGYGVKAYVHATGHGPHGHSFTEELEDLDALLRRQLVQKLNFIVTNK